MVSNAVASRYQPNPAAVELFPGGVGHGMLDNQNIDTGADGVARLQVFPGAVSPPAVTASNGFNVCVAKPAAMATAQPLDELRGRRSAGAGRARSARHRRGHLEVGGHHRGLRATGGRRPRPRSPC